MLLPVRMRNLFPACKNIGTTHITSGCYRLHPVEWGIGEAVGCPGEFRPEAKTDAACDSSERATAERIPDVHSRARRRNGVGLRTNSSRCMRLGGAAKLLRDAPLDELLEIDFARFDAQSSLRVPFNKAKR